MVDYASTYIYLVLVLVSILVMIWWRRSSKKQAIQDCTALHGKNRAKVKACEHQQMTLVDSNLFMAI